MKFIDRMLNKIILFFITSTIRFEFTNNCALKKIVRKIFCRSTTKSSLIGHFNRFFRHFNERFQFKWRRSVDFFSSFDSIYANKFSSWFLDDRLSNVSQFTSIKSQCSTNFLWWTSKTKDFCRRKTDERFEFFKDQRLNELRYRTGAIIDLEILQGTFQSFESVQWRVTHPNRSICDFVRRRLNTWMQLTQIFCDMAHEDYLFLGGNVTDDEEKDETLTMNVFEQKDL